MAPSNETCKAESCAQQATGGKGYCVRHYAAWKRGGLPKGRYKTCRAEGCHKRSVGRGRCEEHLARDYPGRKTAPEAASAVEGGSGGTGLGTAPWRIVN